MENILRHIFYVFIGFSIIGTCTALYLLLRDIIPFEWVVFIILLFLMSYMIGYIVVQFPAIYKEEKELTNRHFKQDK